MPTLGQRFREFLFKKRKWRWIVLAIAIVLTGQLLEERKIGLSAVAAGGERITQSFHNQLETVQPGVIWDRYLATGEMGGDALTAHYGKLPFVGMFDLAAHSVMATPKVAAGVWQDGGWIGRILFVATLLVMAVLLLATWRKPSEDSHPVFMTVLILAFGPAIGAIAFWLALKLLFVLVFVVGKVFAGLTLIAGVVAACWKFVMTQFEILRHADEIEENVGSARASLGANVDAE
jgi:hypothetical protein